MYIHICVDNSLLTEWKNKMYLICENLSNTCEFCIYVASTHSCFFLAKQLFKRRLLAQTIVYFQAR